MKQSCWNFDKSPIEIGEVDKNFELPYWLWLWLGFYTASVLLSFMCTPCAETINPRNRISLFSHESGWGPWCGLGCCLTTLWQSNILWQSHWSPQQGPCWHGLRSWLETWPMKGMVFLLFDKGPKSSWLAADPRISAVYSRSSASSNVQQKSLRFLLTLRLQPPFHQSAQPLGEVGKVSATVLLL